MKEPAAPASPVLDYESKSRSGQNRRARDSASEWQTALAVGRRVLAAWRMVLAGVSVLLSVTGFAFVAMTISLAAHRSMFTIMPLMWSTAAGVPAVALAIPAFMRGRGVFVWIAMLLALAAMMASGCLWVALR